MHDKDNNFATPDDKGGEKKDQNVETPVQPNAIICPQCQYVAKIEENPKFCIVCGFNFITGRPQPNFSPNPPYPANSFAPSNVGQPQGYPYTYSPPIGSNIPPPRAFQTANMPPNMYPPYQTPGIYPPPYMMAPMRKPKTWSLGGGFGVSIFALLLSAIVSLGLGLLILIITGNISSPGAVLIMGSASLIFFIWPLFWMQKYYPRRLSFKERLGELGLPLNKYSPKELGREFLLGTLLALLGVFLVILLQIFANYVVLWTYGVDISSLINESEMNEFDFVSPGDAWSLTAFILLMLLFVGLPEEILFRGFVQRSFEARMPRAPATYLTAIYFAIIHIFIFILVPPLFIFLFIPYIGISILLGLVRNWRNDIFACVALHIIYNIAQTLILYLILSS
jgi:membrane protease YdiL (CAAX protease family)